MRTSARFAIALEIAIAPVALACPAFAQQGGPPMLSPSSGGLIAPPPPKVKPAEAAADGAPEPKQGLSLEFTTLKLLRDRGIISNDDYSATIRGSLESLGDKASDSLTLAAGAWSTTFYGFLETDLIYDSTQSFADAAGTNLVLRGSGAPPTGGTNVQTYPGGNGRTQMSVRNSRFGLLVHAPEFAGIHTSGVLEMDFLGYDPSISQPSTTEQSFFNSPTMRVRHAYARLESPIVNLLVGQTWHTFGWQEAYQPNTVEIQGVPGELYQRTPQVRVSRAFHLGADTAPSVEVMAAALRPPQRDSMIPDLSGGFRVVVPSWVGVHTSGATATSRTPLSFALTGDERNFSLPMFQPLPTQHINLTTASVAASVMVPIIPESFSARGNWLTLVGQAVYGSAIADLYNGMTGGLTFPTIPQAAAQVQGQSWPQDVDNGLVVYDNNPPLQYGQLSYASLHPILWESLLVGLEYYLPACDGRVWVAANYSRMQSPNIATYTQPLPGASDQSTYATAGAVRKAEDWWDVNVFGDILPFFRTGVEFAAFHDHYADGFTATNYRAQVSSWFRF